MGDILELLKAYVNNESTVDVKHLCQMAICRIEQQQNKIEEYKLKYEGKDLVWFERDEVGELDPNHTGLISLAEVKARQAKETYVETLNEILDMWERGEINSLQDLYDSDAISDRHVEKIRKGKDGE